MIVAAGFGFRSGAGWSSLQDAFDHACADAGAGPVTHLATLHQKAGLLAELADRLGLPLVVLAPGHLHGLPTLTRSAAARTAWGIDSVAEACARAAAGGTVARLVAPRVISADRMATCAIAQGAST